MKQLAIIISLTLFSCYSYDKQDAVPDIETNISEDLKVTEESKLISSIDTLHQADTILMDGCNCDPITYDGGFNTDIRFTNSNYDRTKNKDRYLKWKQDSLVNTIKSIRFSLYDTIPAKYAVFKNVERLFIHSREGIHGLDQFPKLKTVQFFGSFVDLNTDENWLRNIEVLTAGKTRFTGLTSFSQMPNLKVLDLDFSGFDQFPTEIEMLSCLTEIRFKAYLFGKLNLSNLNFAENKCLRKIELHTWRKTLEGFPKGLADLELDALDISHPKLTDLEKEKLEQLKARLEDVDR